MSRDSDGALGSVALSLTIGALLVPDENAQAAGSGDAGTLDAKTAPDFLGGKPEVIADPTARRWFDMMQQGKVTEAFNELNSAFGARKIPKTMVYVP
jgi:hypothetical protein